MRTRTAKERKRDAAQGSMTEHPDKPGHFITVVSPTMAEAIQHHEAELLRRRFVHHTRPRSQMTIDEAIEQCRRIGRQAE